jgi:O-antigen/teichoic acid export membrane protein
MGFAFIPIYVHQLGIAAWGLVGFMTMMQAWLLILDMGLTPALSREMARYTAGAHNRQSIFNLFRSLEVAYTAIASIILAVIVLLSSWIAGSWLNAQSIPEKTVQDAIMFMGLIIVMRMTGEVYRGAIQGLQRMVALNLIIAASATSRWGGAAVVLIWVSNTVHAFFLWQAVVSIVTVSALFFQAHKYMPGSIKQGRFEFAQLKKVRHFAGGMLVISVLAVLLTQADTLILSKLLPLKDFGYYMLAATIAGGLLFLVAPISSATYPKLTELCTQNDHLNFSHLYLRSSQWVAVALVPTALVISSHAYSLIFIWTGNSDIAQHTGEILQLLAIGTMLNGFMYMPYMAQLAHGWTRLTITINTAAVAIVIPTLLLTIPTYGAIGAAWIWIGLNLTYLVIGIYFMHKKLMKGKKYTWYLRAIIAPTLITCTGILLYNQYIPTTNERAISFVSIFFLWLVVQSLVAITTPASFEYIKRLYYRHPPLP